MSNPYCIFFKSFLKILNVVKISFEKILFENLSISSWNLKQKLSYHVQMNNFIIIFKEISCGQTCLLVSVAQISRVSKSFCLVQMFRMCFQYHLFPFLPLFRSARNLREVAFAWKGLTGKTSAINLNRFYRRLHFSPFSADLESPGTRRS